ncbi:MAG: hypothetical protein R3E96_10660 [Planctomycetota bacterium]
MRDFALQPAYENNLRQWGCVDIQHLVRYTRNYKIMAWLGNDPLAKDELRLTAEIYRVSTPEVYSSYKGYVQGTGLLAKQIHVANFPGQGVPVGRGEAWGLDASLAAYALSDNQFRNWFRPWFDIFADVMREGQSDCTGNIMSFVIYNYFYGRYAVRQSFEVAMVEQAIRGMCETIYKDLDMGRYEAMNSVREQSTYSTMSEPFWDPVQRGPWFVCAVGSSDLSLIPDLCFDVPREAHSGHIDVTDYWNALAYSYNSTQDPFLLSRIEMMLDAAVGILGHDQLQEVFRIEARAGLIALFESALPQ